MCIRDSSVPSVRFYIPERIVPGISHHRSGSGNQFSPIILGDLPKTNAAQPQGPGQFRFGSNGGHVVVGDEGVLSIEIRNLRLLMPQLAISALVQIRIFDGFIADGSCGSICAVQAVVFADVYKRQVSYPVLPAAKKPEERIEQ